MFIEDARCSHLQVCCMHTLLTVIIPIHMKCPDDRRAFWNCSEDESQFELVGSSECAEMPPDDEY